MTQTRDLIDSNTVAELLGSTKRHVQNLCSNRQLPHFKVGGLLRFDRAEILAWLEEQRREVVA